MTAAVLKFEPRIGRIWWGGVFAARLPGYDLVVGPHRVEPTDWSGAVEWASSVCAFGRCDFSLPRLDELVALAGAFPRFFEGARYWTSETHGELSADALVLCAGLAGHWGKHFLCDAICVRREFNERSFP